MKTLYVSALVAVVLLLGCSHQPSFQDVERSAQLERERYLQLLEQSGRLEVDLRYLDDEVRLNMYTASEAKVKRAEWERELAKLQPEVERQRERSRMAAERFAAHPLNRQLTSK
jgi:peptidoglycan hydrolase CwlO-like protein